MIRDRVDPRHQQPLRWTSSASVFSSTLLRNHRNNKIVLVVDSIPINTYSILPTSV